MVRRVAIAIAESAGVTELQTEMVALALDKDESYQIRYKAARMVSEIGDDEACASLDLLMKTTEDEDPDDQLRGYAMRALWTRQLVDLHGILGAISTPRNSSLMGSYESFLSEDFVPLLREEDFPTALDWLGRTFDVKSFDVPGGLNRFSDAVVIASVAHIENQEILQRLGVYLILRLRNHSGLLSRFAREAHRESIAKECVRRRLVSVVVDEMREFDADILHRLMRIVQKGDLGWLLDQSAVSAVTVPATIYAKFARLMVDPTSESDCQLVATFAKRSAVVSEVVSGFLSAWRTRELVEDEKFIEILEEGVESIVDSGPSIADRISDYLDRFAGGDVDAWWQMNCLMTLEASGQVGISEGEGDLREMPGWQYADESVRSRIVSSAPAYLERGNPGDSLWLGMKEPFRPACAGYRALLLLANENQNALDAIPREMWKKWAAAVVSFPVSGATGESLDCACDLVKRCYDRAPEETRSAVVANVEREDANDGRRHLFVLRKLRDSWDGQLCSVLLERVVSGVLGPGSIGEILGEALQRGFRDARDLAESMLSGGDITESCVLESEMKAAYPLGYHDQEPPRSGAERIRHERECTTERNLSGGWSSSRQHRPRGGAENAENRLGGGGRRVHRSSPEHCR